ncbi:hypothetical protein F4677DRAFT_236402 [Hypoxylon crocopeplum]|nr:hypothetical protein F4677DRAFT_236402 [Hypoxylon crocopeplum]
MVSSPTPERSFDPSKPFEGLVLCCTSVEADLRTEIALRTVDLGGIHKYDLTPDVTHLIVGEYDTAKYRHVARERPDIKPMAAGWVEAVRELWLEDKEFDFDALEDTWRLKTFETGGGVPKSPIKELRERTKLVCCLTGFEDSETRVMIEEKVRANGGDYVGDLSRRVTHLIVCKPEGKKYVAARKWQIRTVSIEWLHDSVKRGMILNEECYDPTLPVEERGKGAWIKRDPRRGGSLGKRSRDGATAPPADDGRRKLRKTASMKLMSQRDNVWGDILVNQSSLDLTHATTTAVAPDERPASVPPLEMADLAAPTVGNQQVADPSHAQQIQGGVFSSCRFYVHDFPRHKQEIVRHHISSHDGQTSDSVEDAASSSHPEPMDRRYVIVPQTSQSSSYPRIPEEMHIVTEFYVERCVHNKILFNPGDHVLGQPFPQFPIEGFGELTICTAGFRNEQLNQMEKAIVQLGAKYSERLNTQCSLLICPSLENVRKQKLDFAVLSKIPVVGADWIWRCITTGSIVPWDNFLFQGLAQKVPVDDEVPSRKDKDKLARSKSEPVPRKEPRPRPSLPATKHGIDMTAFDDDTPMPVPIPQETTAWEQDTDESNYDTAPSHLAESIGINPMTAHAPLSEMTSNALNKSPSPSKIAPAPRKLKRFPTGGEVGDSESDGEFDVPIDPEKEDGVARNQDEDRQRQEQAKAAEREEMSKRLNSLMSRDGTAQDGTSIKPQSAPKQQRRRRTILGRAASNVSTASSASAESSQHLSSSKSNLRRTESLASRMDSIQPTASAFGLLDKLMQHSEESNQATENGDSPPRATQIQYDNPEARQHRAAVLNRMTSRNKQDEPNGSKQCQEKGPSVSLENENKLSGISAAAAGPARRSMRRR